MNRLSSQRGFVLALTLWTLTAMTVAAGFFALWTQNVLHRAHQEQQDVRALVEMSSTQATILYFFAVQHITLAGLSVPVPPEVTENTSSVPVKPKKGLGSLEDEQRGVMPSGGEIALDDTVYMGLGRARFSIQDKRGLLAVNYVGSAQISSLLGLLGVPAGERSILTDRLLDYTDKDDLVRLNGAESADYVHAGLSPPPNRLLLTSWEARNVLGWKDRAELWESGRFARLTTVTSGSIPNLNTAPELVLKTIPGVDDVTARRIMNVRRKVPFNTLGAIDRAAGKYLNIEVMGLALLPSANERITLWCEGGKRMKEIHVQLMPRGNWKTPWLIDHVLTLPLTSEQESAHAQPVSTPLFAPPVSANSN